MHVIANLRFGAVEGYGESAVWQPREYFAAHVVAGVQDFTLCAIVLKHCALVVMIKLRKDSRKITT